MHRARYASSRGLARVSRPFRAPSASIALARQPLLPRPASPAELPRLPLPLVLSGFRRRAGPPQDSAPAARTAGAPCCRDFCSSASLLSLACFSRDASSLAFVASAVWVSTLAPGRRKILLQPRGPLAPLLQRLLQLRFAALACLFQPGRFLACFRRQCRLGLDVAPGRRKILLQPRGPLAPLLQGLLQLRFAAPACLFQPGRFLACFLASAVWVSTSRRAAARSCSSRADRSRPCCRDFCSSASLLPLACFSRDASSLAFVASAVCVSTSRRAAARSCSSRADRSRSCCRDFCSSASLLPLACFSRAASSLAFAASAVWVSTSRRAAARSCSSRADRSRSCCRDFCSSASPLPLACFSRDASSLALSPVPFGSRPRAAPPQDPAPAARTARAPVAETSAAPLRCSRLPVSAGTLPRLLCASAVWVSTSRRAAARSCSSRADRSRSCCKEVCTSAAPLSPPVSAGTLAHLPSPPARSAFRPRAAPPQEPAPAARPDRAPARDVAAVRCRALQS